MKKLKVIKGFVIFLIMFSLTACGVSIKENVNSFLRPNVDIGYIKKVAVLPFSNHSSDKLAAVRARDIVITQILSRHIFDVIDKSIVDSVLQEEAIEPGSPLDKAIIKRLGQRLNVQALILGSIDQAGYERNGMFSYPVISLTLRLVDTRSGLVLWQASGYDSGYSLIKRLFGLAPSDPYEVTLRLVDNLLDTIPLGK